MQNIEDFFKTHKDDFDELKADPKIWNDIDKELNKGSKIFSIKRHYWLKIAATAAVFIYIILFLHTSMNNKHDSLNTVVIENQNISDQQAALIKNNKVNIGLSLDMYFPDISLRNPQGELVSISELKGKIVLVQFWASYSVVCTEENCYYFKPVYEEFKEKGFEIYGVSVDSSALHWVNAIQKDKLDWVQVSDLKGDQSPLFEEFEVQELPTTFLIDKNGKIIDKNIDSDLLKDKLNQLLAFN